MRVGGLLRGVGGFRWFFLKGKYSSLNMSGDGGTHRARREMPAFGSNQGRHEAALRAGGRGGTQLCTW